MYQIYVPPPATTDLQNKEITMANKLCRLLSLDRSPLSVSISQQMRHLSDVSYPATPSQEASRSASTPSEKEEKEKVESKQIEEPTGDGDGEKGLDVNKLTGEVGGPKGPEPTRYGDWEQKGRCSDF
ncbi:succinate dehydrogenase assembly factor 4 [Carex littledalei]|uniref:Succinate dehydrogenase assembly factor 4, mitochondrial n=1 Tax=Carex littledalei TaxID=544730 RepID=A0A833QSR0_9POAL|nr:succinate dehydrogenase assembly factor 4 [Carex littledalei]